MENLDAVLSRQHFSGEFILSEKGYSLDYPWKNREFIEAHVTGGSMTGSLFEDCTFRNTTFENIYMDDVDFVRCRFENFRIINCSRDGMEMRECTGSPPIMIGTKEGPPGWRDRPPPPGWESHGKK
ncbi:hypothetical protein AUJ46_01190 [Candidatus Peregrinibacteria bacterium CG1_02_54_53]|nr:MAG: hypothetical protein AUJ46_01190 [Candidatus Peregrinibacteria bacterium CG1_02_54_53]